MSSLLMQALTRSSHILKVIGKVGRVSVNDLAEELNVSVETIRRDLKILDNKGEVVRVHGGAICKQYRDEGTSFNNRANNNIIDKKHLVDKVISNIYEGSV
ncbi:DeoR family transcriptional regulator, partial [Vibrio parahaemolyticus]